MKWQPFEDMSSWWLSLTAVGCMIVALLCAADGNLGWDGVAFMVMACRAIKILGRRAEAFERRKDGTGADPP